MTTSSLTPSRGFDLRVLAAVIASPAVAMFISSNVANAGNLLFNMLFGRWMGPELFADLATMLTLKLSLMAILSAVQMAVSQMVSGKEAGFAAKSLRAMNWAGFVVMGLALPVLVPPALTGALGTALGIGSGSALVLLLLALPVTVPLSIARGIAVGQLQVGRIVWSANLEMAVRLGGAVVMWQAGFGIAGVAGAIAASLVVAWLPVRRTLTVEAQASDDVSVLRPVLVLALPFAVLQAAQVAHLDGDVLVANAVLSGADAGLVAVLSLFQRIQFFACFGLAAVLLPAVTAAVARGDNGLREAAPVAGLFAMVSAVCLAVVALAPAQVISIMVGPAFAAAAPVLLIAAICAALFTFSYLCAVFMSAHGDKRGIWLIAAFVPVQLGSFALLAAGTTAMDLAQMLVAKLACQAVLALMLVAMILLRQRAHPSCSLAA